MIQRILFQIWKPISPTLNIGLIKDLPQLSRHWVQRVLSLVARAWVCVENIKTCGYSAVHRETARGSADSYKRPKGEQSEHRQTWVMTSSCYPKRKYTRTYTPTLTHSVARVLETRYLSSRYQNLPPSALLNIRCATTVLHRMHTVFPHISWALKRHAFIICLKLLCVMSFCVEQLVESMLGC